MDIVELIEVIRKAPGCTVHPPAGLPQIKPEHVLPDDLKTFYTLTGGMTIFNNSSTYVEISSPQKCLLSNLVIFEGILSDEDLYSDMNHASWSWYIAGKAQNAQWYSIDLHPDRLGICYNSFWDVHPGNSEIIALSFTSLIADLLLNNAESDYWKSPEIQPK